jgi:glutathione peroxidase
MNIYDLRVTAADGSEVSLSDYQGKVIMVVNTATGCGFTPHYEPIEKMYEDFHEKGFEVIDVPCNQFAGQTPGTDEEIHDFCAINFGTEFPQMKKSDVNGPDALPLFTWLKEQKGFEGFGHNPMALAMSAMLKKIDKDYKTNPDIKWNFTKFVVDRDGNVVERFEPTANMDKVRACVAALVEE